MEVPHPWGEIVWTYAEDNIIEEKDYHKDIGLCMFGHTLFG